MCYARHARASTNPGDVLKRHVRAGTNKLYNVLRSPRKGQHKAWQCATLATSEPAQTANCAMGYAQQPKPAQCRPCSVLCSPTRASQNSESAMCCARHTRPNQPGSVLRSPLPSWHKTATATATTGTVFPEAAGPCYKMSHCNTVTIDSYTRPNGSGCS